MDAEKIKEAFMLISEQMQYVQEEIRSVFVDLQNCYEDIARIEYECIFFFKEDKILKIEPVKELILDIRNNIIRKNIHKARGSIDYKHTISFYYALNF